MAYCFQVLFKILIFFFFPLFSSSRVLDIGNVADVALLVLRKAPVCRVQGGVNFSFLGWNGM